MTYVHQVYCWYGLVSLTDGWLRPLSLRFSILLYLRRPLEDLWLPKIPQGATLAVQLLIEFSPIVGQAAKRYSRLWRYMQLYMYL